MYEPTMDMPTAQPGIDLPADMNCSDEPLRQANQQPYPTTAMR